MAAPLVLCQCPVPSLLPTFGLPLPPTHGVIECGIKPHELQEVLQDLLRGASHHGVPAGTARKDLAPRAGHWPAGQHSLASLWPFQQAPPRGAREQQRWQGTEAGGMGTRLLSPAAPCHGWLAAATLQVLLQHQHHLAMLLQPHGVGLHVLGRAARQGPSRAGTPKAPPVPCPWRRGASPGAPCPPSGCG